MSLPVVITKANAEDYFSLEVFTPDAPVGAFQCHIEEYTDYLRKGALQSQADHVARTWLLVEKESFKIAAYMSLIADAVKLSNAEKELHKLHYPFKTIPAVKIGKSAVDETFQRKYRGLGSLMVYHTHRIATETINEFIAARFLTVDADIEHDTGVLAFYDKLGFVPNEEINKGKRKTISMRADVYS
jgi:ribosomal protein S18 acetylase RimI-like enzyme